jgi:hypothetical protein
MERGNKFAHVISGGLLRRTRLVLSSQLCRLVGASPGFLRCNILAPVVWRYRSGRDVEASGWSGRMAKASDPCRGEPVKGVNGLMGWH